MKRRMQTSARLGRNDPSVMRSNLYKRGEIPTMYLQPSFVSQHHLEHPSSPKQIKKKQSQDARS